MAVLAYFYIIFSDSDRRSAAPRYKIMYLILTSSTAKPIVHSIHCFFLVGGGIFISSLVMITSLEKKIDSLTGFDDIITILCSLELGIFFNRVSHKCLHNVSSHFMKTKFNTPRLIIIKFRQHIAYRRL